MPNYGSKFSKKTYSQLQLLVCLMLKEYLGLDYTTTEALLCVADELCFVMGLEKVPDHTTLWWFFQKNVSPSLLEAVLAETVHLQKQALLLGAVYNLHRAVALGIFCLLFHRLLILSWLQRFST